MDKNLSNSKKRLLFIGVGFRNYDELLANYLSKRYKVVYVNTSEYEQQHRVLYKILVHCCKKISERLCANYIMKNIRVIATNVDKLFVVKGEHLTGEHFDYIKQHNNIERTVLYLWDKWSAHKNIYEIRQYFDDIYSFDIKDCEEQGVKLRPLFYFENQIKARQEKTIDVSFVGINHTGRYELLKRVKRICKENGFNYKFCLLIGKIEYTKFLLFPFLMSKYSQEDAEMFSENGIPYDEYVDIISSSKVVLDIQLEGQSGLTMRTIESLAMGARIITANPFIKQYKDISRNNYLILNKNTTDNDIVKFICRNSDIDVDSLPKRYSCSEALLEMIK